MAGFTQKEDSELVVQRKKEKAVRVLGFDRFHRPTTKSEIMKRYTDMVKAMHPDARGKTPLFNAPYTLEEIRQAKDYLVKHLEKEND